MSIIMHIPLHTYAYEHVYTDLYLCLCDVMQCNQMQCIVWHGKVRVSRPLQSSA